MAFKLDFITQIIYCIIHKCLYSLFILLSFFYISFQETERRNNAKPSKNWQNFNKMNEKGS